MNPDPAGLRSAVLGAPQIWNRYAYALGNPLNYIDPSGLFCVWVDDGTYDDSEGG
jgi:RHS repeat-associated protein